MSQAFPAPYIYPIDRANQNKALQQADWGGMANYGAVSPAISFILTFSANFLSFA